MNEKSQVEAEGARESHTRLQQDAPTCRCHLRTVAAMLVTECGVTDPAERNLHECVFVCLCVRVRVGCARRRDDAFNPTPGIGVGARTQSLRLSAFET